jgi:hypothetical protein
VADGVKIEMIPTPAAKLRRWDSLILERISATGASRNVGSKRSEVLLRQCVDCKMRSLIARQEIGVVIVEPAARFSSSGQRPRPKHAGHEAAPNGRCTGAAKQGLPWAPRLQAAR